MKNDTFRKNTQLGLENATVKISTASGFKGTGFFISFDGYILTAWHCIKEVTISVPLSPSIIVEYDGNTFEIEKPEADKSLPDQDIAVLKINYSTQNCVPLGLITEQHKGDEVMAVGYPAGYINGRDMGVYIGIIHQFIGDDIETSVIEGEGQSGGLIYHFATQRLIGLAKEVYHSHVTKNTGLAVRFDALFDKWRELKTINDKVAQAWDERLAKFEDSQKKTLTPEQLRKLLMPITDIQEELSEIGLTGWAVPVHKALKRLQNQPKPTVQDYINVFEAFIHFHFVTLASQFYWFLPQDKSIHTTEEVKAGLSVLYESLTDPACGGGATWLRRCGVLSRACTQIEALPFPQLAEILEPATLVLDKQPNTNQDTQAANPDFWTIKTGGTRWEVLNTFAALRTQLERYEPVNLKTLNDDAIEDKLVTLLDTLGIIFQPIQSLQLAMVSEIEDDNKQRQRGIHGYWHDNDFLCVTQKLNFRKMAKIWQPLEELGKPNFLLAPKPPHPQWEWNESLLLYDAKQPSTNYIYLMPFGFRYRHRDVQPQEILPGLLDSVRWKKNRVASVIQRAYREELPPLNWQTQKADDEVAQVKPVNDCIEKLVKALCDKTSATKTQSISIHPQFDLQPDQIALPLADIFNNPHHYVDFLTAQSDDDFKGQYLERKEAGKLKKNGNGNSSTLNRLKEQIIETISAFANENKEGGLLVLGISKSGELTGIEHLQEKQINSLTDFLHSLRHQAVKTKTVEFPNNTGSSTKILLILVSYCENAICETIEAHPRAWIRSGSQNIAVDDYQRDRLKREKGIHDFERTICCPFDLRDVDTKVLKEFREPYLAEATYHLNDEELLYNAGAIVQKDDNYLFTNAGFLFFSFNPQRQFSWASLRLLRFEVNYADFEYRGLPTYDKTFTGSISQQIRKVRTILRDSGFFKIYQKRKPEGGFIEEPEYPYLALDEAVVNAVAHRDYGIQLPIECIAYKDAFVVRNPGKLLQRDQDVPHEFSLQDKRLDSMPRNFKLMEWLRMMRDEKGTTFVKALSEGTRRMRDEMKAALLQAPRYEINHTSTRVTLFNNVIEREKLLHQSLPGEPATEYTNLFPLFSNTDKTHLTRLLKEKRQEFRAFLRDSLVANGWYLDGEYGGRITTHQTGAYLPLLDLKHIVRFYPAYTIQLREYFDTFYLCIDYTLQVKNVLSLRALCQKRAPALFFGKTAVARRENWKRGKIIRGNVEFTTIYFFDTQTEIEVSSDKVIPDLPIDMIRAFLLDERVNIDKEIKRHSLTLGTGAARLRKDKTLQLVKQMAQTVFPILMMEDKIYLGTKPEVLNHYGKPNQLKIQLLPEPVVEFSHHHETPNIQEGITSFGAYEDAKKAIEIVPICVTQMKDKMVSLIDRITRGKYRYAGVKRTFHALFTYHTVITVSSPESILKECEHLLEVHPDWIGNAKTDRIFLVHTPKVSYSLDDENAPYYRIKRFLLEHGIPCQMVDTPILTNPDWKDLNLALNIVAKCGITPWVLPNRIPDADFFIGLSYTQSQKGESERLMGYATVFDEFGRWEFYSGNSEVFSYDERTQYFSALTEQTLKRLTTLSETPSIYFHYSAKFSKEDRKAILAAARQVRPEGTYAFISINQHHNIRLYDARPETDGSLSRGYYVITGSNRILLSTTGYNPYRKSLGTPKPLEITIWTTKPDGSSIAEFDLRALANQILSLTKLNWASTNAICGEPITTKFAGNIAYLTAAFLRQSEIFQLHPVLEKTPWFI
jgi:predicted HTH transcriptional regulator